MAFEAPETRDPDEEVGVAIYEEHGPHVTAMYCVNCYADNDDEPNDDENDASIRRRSATHAPGMACHDCKTPLKDVEVA